MSTTLSVEPTLREGVELSKTTLGRYTEVGRGSYLENVQMGDYSYCGPSCFFQNVEIRKFSNIAAAVRIGPTRHPTDRATLHHFTYRRRMYGFDSVDDEEFFAWRAEQVARVGHDTWIGHGAIIMPNITVGTGSVVGAGAVVTRDIPPYSIAVGVPAAVIKRRFQERVAQRLEGVGWWNWSHETLRERLEDFTLPVEAFLEKYADKSEERQ
jgi:hypothetical protein